MGIHNYLETTMSLRSMEIKKNIDVVTIEYSINNIVRRVYEFMVGELIEFVFHGKGDIGRQLIRINQGM